METDFAYTGKAMRALAMISLTSHGSCRLTHGSHAKFLTDYKPVEFLIESPLPARYTVIGRLYTESWYERINDHSSPRWIETTRLECGTDIGYNYIFAHKLRELLSLTEMNPIDRARLEELRTFYFNIMCQTMFEIEGVNFPRVLTLIMAIKSNLAQDGTIREDRLSDVIPTECAALASRESILSKDFIGLDGVVYRINQGLANFAKIVEDFNLLSGHMLALLHNALH